MSSFGKQETFGDLEDDEGKEAAAPETSRFSQLEPGGDEDKALEGEAV